MDTLTPTERQEVYATLVRGAERAASPAARWEWLMAAHVVGQQQVRLHFDSHRRMLRLAAECSDPREVVGQLLRITLLPLGHLLRRIPRGNIGRATVGVTQVMEPPEPVQMLIDWAVLGARLPGSRW
ncbi:MAG TPA: DUF3703 domain-containing protein [Ramlibacter sp.]|jgi:hypothetical protein|uniref:DUF3703 domain-containing protein n=1 Tax=Ramlibacter sp. TaxID=1917967 RepID=UPI002D504301|nr:DUF3703 domain-containing protein [Ramlibacter sp.]HZY17163.1 DUF3703 domain-containing protein [Ramlibacter sp.]